MGISSSGIGSGLDIESLISKLMTAESAPLASYDTKTSALQTRLAALGKVSSAVSTFQSSLSTLSSASTFRALTTTSTNEKLLTASAGTSAVPGKYKVNVTQLAQSQSLNTVGQASLSTLIGAGATTTLTFQFGSVGGGLFGLAGSALGGAVATNGIANGSLTINGTAIATDGATNSARALATAINAKSDTTGVTASASTSTAATLFAGFGAVDVGASGSYALSVGGVQLASQNSGDPAIDAAAIDAALADSTTSNALAAAGISFTGSAADGSLRFSNADGSNINVTETTSGGTVTGGIGKAAGVTNAGSSTTAVGGVKLDSSDSSPIAIGGSAPSVAGFTAGSGGSYLDAGFTQDGTRPSGTVTLSAADQSLTGIRDAINKANMGVTASIVSDGGANPYHLVLTSDKTGEKSSMKIMVSGEDGAAPDPALAALLGYDPGGEQSMRQTSAALSTKLDVNGIAVSSDSNDVSEAIQGVTLSVADLGSSTITVTRNTTAVSDAVSAFVKAYNDLNKTISSLTSYSADTKTGGPLQGDAAVRSIQTTLRRQIGASIGDGNLTTLSQVGVAFQRDGSLALDSSKLTKAINEGFEDVGQLFAELGNATDGLVQFAGSTTATKAGKYDLEITALATRGHLTGAAALAGTTTISANTTWSVSLNQTEPATASKIQSIDIPAGTYDNTQLAAMLRSAINGNATYKGAGDSVETEVDSNGVLTISSSNYGSTSNITVTSLTGTDPSVLFGGANSVAGTDVEGTIGGVAATGSGQNLTAAAGSAADGMKLTITGGALGARGTVTFSQGVAFQLNSLATGFIGTNGLIPSKSDGINVSIKAIASEKDRFNTRLADIEKRYRAQFTALDTMLASMQQTQSYLTQQLAAIANNS